MNASLRKAGRWLASTACSVIGVLMLMAFFGSVLAGRTGNLQLEHLARIDIDDNKVPRIVCKALLQNIADLKASREAESQRLMDLDSDAQTYQQTYAKEDFHRFWGAPGSDEKLWGTGRWEYERKTVKLAEQHTMTDPPLRELMTVLSAVEQQCTAAVS